MFVPSAWQLIGSQAAFCSATVTPASGILAPNEEKEFCIELTANITVSLKTGAYQNSGAVILTSTPSDKGKDFYIENMMFFLAFNISEIALL